MNKVSVENRMKAYLQKIAAGPKLSKNLTENEAEDALSLIPVSYTHLTLPTKA